jgi:hypothetical protein
MRRLFFALMVCFISPPQFWLVDLDPPEFLNLLLRGLLQ